MTIAHVLSSFHVGGQEKVALDLAVGQRALGHTVIAVSLAPPPEGPLAAQFEERGIRVFSVPKQGRGLDLTLPQRLAALFRRERVDVVHTHNQQPLIYASLPGRGVGAVVVQSRHGRSTGGDREAWLRRQAGRLVHAYVAVSAEVAETARQVQACAEEKLVIIENGIDLDRFHPDPGARRAIRAELGIPPDAFVIGMVARLVDYKNPSLLLRAARPLLGAGCHLIFVGDGPERERLRREVAGTPAAQAVHLVGQRLDVPALLAALDTFALSSDTEGHPLVVIEAMATGLPVVSTAAGGIPGMIADGETGYLVPIGDSAALGERLGRLVADRPLATQMGGRAREVALGRYAARRMVEDYLALYERCRQGLALGRPGAATEGATGAPRARASKQATNTGRGEATC
jgi:glycosyltransferase involved in cell wall biosynthesis